VTKLDPKGEFLSQARALGAGADRGKAVSLRAELVDPHIKVAIYLECAILRENSMGTGNVDNSKDKEAKEALAAAIDGDKIEVGQGEMPGTGERGLVKYGKLPWETLTEPGRFFKIPLAVGIDLVNRYGTFRAIAQRKGIRIGIRRTTEGLEIWRVADK